MPQSHGADSTSRARNSTAKITARSVILGDARDCETLHMPQSTLILIFLNAMRWRPGNGLASRSKTVTLVPQVVQEVEAFVAGRRIPAR
jgi:hypothetical protein